MYCYNVETDAEATFTSHSKKPLSVASDLQHSSTSSKRKRNEKDSALQKLMGVEEEKLRYLKQNSEKLQDDDRYFALSLVPYLRQLPTHRKMFVRAKFQEILAQEHEALHRNNISPQQSSTPSFHYGASTPSPSYSGMPSIELLNQQCLQSSIDSDNSSCNRDTTCNNGGNPSSDTASNYFSNFM